MSLKSKSEVRVYCRHCGENKGHSTAACVNAAAIKRNLESTTQELNEAMEKVKRLREIERDLVWFKDQNQTLNRIIMALLDLTEKQRSA